MAPKKPTHPYGTIDFHKDGTVTKQEYVLPDTKSGQEIAAAHHFLRYRFPELEPSAILRPLAERDHDFRIEIPGQQSIELQLTELVRRDYMVEIDFDEWFNNAGKYPDVVQEPAEGNRIRIFSIDQELKRNSIAKKIERKNAKYARSASDLWLLVWMVESESHYYVIDSDGNRIEDPSVLAGRQSATGLGSRLIFDEIWITNLLVRPHQIHPVPSTEGSSV